MKNLLALILCVVFLFSLTACGRTMNDITNDAESIGDSVVSNTESMVDDATSSIKDDKKSMNLMAGITPQDAKQAALRHAKLDEGQIRDVDIDLDRDNGRLIYEVDFNSGNTEYDYDIDAETGAVISADKSRD